MSIDGVALLALVRQRVDPATRALLNGDPSIAQRFSDACISVAQRYPSAALDDSFAWRYVGLPYLLVVVRAVAARRVYIYFDFLTLSFDFF